MLEAIREWLNGKQEYSAGVNLYALTGSNTALCAVLEKGPTPFTIKRLHAELLTIYNNLKPQSYVLDNSLPAHAEHQSEVPEISVLRNEPENSNIPVSANEPLYLLCKEAADKAYKQVMNERAVLFRDATPDDFTDPNRPDLVAGRRKQAIAIVTAFQKVSQLYDKAAYVREHGRLPGAGDDQSEEMDAEAIPDGLVKQKLDNLRKNVSKMKKREQTPDRLALLQKHQSDIQKLENRWLSLKPPK